MIYFNKLSPYKLLVHFSTTIEGGVSEGYYSSLNLGLYSGDKPENVCENRKRLSDQFGFDVDLLYTPYQTHEDKILVIDENFLSQSTNEKQQALNEIDAVVTDQKNIAIGISTADCVPILIYDPIKHVFAAIHAGWRGPVAKIVSKTILRMEKEYGSSPTTLLVAIGPAISRKYFEVGNEVVEQFRVNGFSINDISYMNNQTGKRHIDLKLANKTLLSESGISADNIEVSEYCTYSDSDLFFSARRQTVYSGRMITGGMLK